MTHDPELVAETKAWFVKAANDLRAAEILREAAPLHDAIMGRVPLEVQP